MTRLPKVWDVSIDLTPANLDNCSLVPHRLVERVLEVVETLPGAHVVSVEFHGSAPSSLRWLTLYEPGSCPSFTGPEWDDLQHQIEHAVREVTGAL